MVNVQSMDRDEAPDMCGARTIVESQPVCTQHDYGVGNATLHAVIAVDHSNPHVDLERQRVPSTVAGLAT